MPQHGSIAFRPPWQWNVVEGARGDLDGAEAALRTAVSVMRTLLEGCGEHATYMYDLGLLLLRLRSTLQRREEHNEAETVTASWREVAEGLSGANPDSAERLRAQI